ncbi:MAG: putative permease component of transporter [Holophagaceae bacterium]|nr:putative permease component of transporter [Holophagaceae bacterium]
MGSRYSRRDEGDAIPGPDPGSFHGTCQVVHKDDFDPMAIDLQESEQFQGADFGFQIDLARVLPRPFPEEVRQPHECVDFRGLLHGHAPPQIRPDSRGLTVLETLWLLSRSGPLGSLGLLYTPTAMTLAQVFLVIPLMVALTRQIVEDAWNGYSLELRSFGYSPWLCIRTLLVDCRFSLVVAVIAGLGRAISEVGAVMIVGGNILGFTRVMTTAIALETAKGDLPLSIALGAILLSIVIPLNAVAYGIRRWAMNRFG